MPLPYLTVPFSLSDPSWYWLRNTTKAIASEYQINAVNDASVVHPSKDFLQQWNNSKARIEIQEFFSKFGILSNTFNPIFFIYKQLDNPNSIRKIEGNPHIDTVKTATNPSADAKDITFRFNMLIWGAEDLEMVWWNKNRHDPCIISKNFILPDKRSVARLEVKGENSREKWNIIGEPDWSCNSLSQLNKKSSFVRTDILHALNWPRNQARFVLSFMFFQPWDVIEKCRKSTD